MKTIRSRSLSVISFSLGLVLVVALGLQGSAGANGSPSPCRFTVTGLTIAGVEGQAFTGVVANVSASPLSTPASSFSATIAWGDGTSSAGTVTHPTTTGPFVVSGTHTYALRGSYTTTITVKEGSGSSVGHGCAIIAQAPIVVTGSAISGVEGLAFSGTVATFTQSSSTAPVSRYAATIAWGDGSSSTGTISQIAPGDPYAVTGTHTYMEEGSYITSITVSASSNSTTANGSAVIADAPITASSVTVAPQTTATAFTVPVATFVDENPYGSSGEFTATITWDDGSLTSTGTITQPGGIGTVFDVAGSHTYAAHGTYTVGVTVDDDGGSTSSISDTVTVADTVVNCASSGCSGTASTSQQSSHVTSTSTVGTILADIDPTGVSCGDPFRHAPQVTTVTDTGLNANLVFTVTFANSAAAGPWWVPFAVCYTSDTPFQDIVGHTVTTGLLPICGFPPSSHAIVAPCVQSINPLPLGAGNVVETIIVPAGDPRFH